MSDLQDLREDLRCADQSAQQSNKWLIIFAIAFPIFGLGLGAGVKFVMDVRHQNIAAQEAAREFAENIPDKSTLLSNNDSFLKMGKLEATDPYVLATDQVRLYRSVIGKLKTCGKQTGAEKYERLADSYRLKNKKAHQQNNSIVNNRMSNQMDKVGELREKVNKSNSRLGQIGAIMQAKSSGMMSQHGAIMTSGFGSIGGQYNKPVPGSECLKLSSDVAQGKKKIKGVKI